MVQFHQSYSYEDFVQGWRPKTAGGFERRDGPFYSFCNELARSDPSPHVFIIDEINRGNLSKILGEVMMLVERDKRHHDYALTLTYSAEDEEPFFVPPNVHVIGLMNTADRSLALVDYALRRRFRFCRLRPRFDSPAYRRYLHDNDVTDNLIERIVEKLTKLNRAISDDRDLGAGFEIGHSFFCPNEGEERLDETWYESVVRGEVLPLLEEYWFDKKEQVERWSEELLQ